VDHVFLDLAADLFIGAGKRPDQVSATDEPHEGPVEVDDRQSVDVLVEHDLCSLGKRTIGQDRSRRRRHRITDRHGVESPVDPWIIGVDQPPKEATATTALAALLREDVGFGHHSEHPPFAAHDRHARDSPLYEFDRSVLEWGVGADRGNVGRHYVLNSHDASLG
jgi:hypothetical protein